MLPRFWMAERCLTMTCCARHARRALRQRHRRDHRQELGRQADGERDGEEQRLERGRCIARLAARMNRTSTKTVRVMSSPKCRRPRSNSVSGARAASRAAMSPNWVARPVATTRAVAVPLTTDVPSQTVPRASPSGASAVFSDGQRLAGQRGLLHVQIARFEQVGVGRDEIAGAEADDVARDDLAAGQLVPGAVAQARSPSARPVAGASRRPSASARSARG